MDQIKGAQSIMFREAPYLISAASVAGSKEGDVVLDEATLTFKII